MERPFHLLLLSPHRVWAGLFKLGLENLLHPLAITALVYDHGLPGAIADVLAAGPDLVIVSVGQPFPDLTIAQALRDQGWQGPMMLLCTDRALPSLQALQALRIAGLALFSADLAEIVAVINALADGRAPSLQQQYLGAARGPGQQSARWSLTKREIEILQLVAADLPDVEIAARLDRSPRTISEALSRIYGKLGVRGRGGAVGRALAEGLIRLPS